MILMTIHYLQPTLPQNQMSRKLIVDTPYLIWDLQGNKRFEYELPILETYGDEIYICAISYWEVAMLVGKKKVSFPFTISQFFTDLIRLRGYKVLHLTPEIADMVARHVDDINGDPADRIIAATSIVHNAQLLTADSDLRGTAYLDIV